MNDDERPDEPTEPLVGWRPVHDALHPIQPESGVEESSSEWPDLTSDEDASAGHDDPTAEQDTPQEDGPTPDDVADGSFVDSAPDTMPMPMPLQVPEALAMQTSAVQPQGPPPYSPYSPYASVGPSGPPPAPGQHPPGPYGFPAYATHSNAPRVVKTFPLWAWPAVAGLALVVSLLGGLAGAALQDALAAANGTVSNGLEGVRTQAAAPLADDNGSVQAVAQALLPSTVQILAEYDGQAAGATGSGFVLDRDGHVVTNNHVVASAAADDGPITVIDHRGRRHAATIVGRSSVYDLAVLAVEDAEGLQPAALGDSEGLLVGEPVVAFGAPLGLSQTVTSGIVSALNRPVTTSGESNDDSSYINAVQTDAAINPGNSGGPLVNLAGQVVGVNSAIATTGGAGGGESGNIGVGFAIPIEQVRTTVDQILRTGKAEYPVIGAQVRTVGESNAQGATITEVMKDTPAERAGLLKDDLIVAVDDQAVGDGIALIVAIRTHLPGEKVEMSVVREGKRQVVIVELDGQVG